MRNVPLVQAATAPGAVRPLGAADLLAATTHQDRRDPGSAGVRGAVEGRFCRNHRNLLRCLSPIGRLVRYVRHPNTHE